MPELHRLSQFIASMLRSVKLAFIQSCDEPYGTVEKDAKHIEQTVLNVYGHLKYTKPVLDISSLTQNNYQNHR